MTRALKARDESAADRRLRIYHQERLKEEASMGLDRLIRDGDFQTRTEFARRIERSKSFVTKILNSHNFQLETLSDAYFAIGYAIHLSLVPRETEELRAPAIDSSGTAAATTALELSQDHPALGILITPHVGKFRYSSASATTEQITR